jgi:hypothetical protein
MPETKWWESFYSLSREPFKLGSRWLYLVARKIAKIHKVLLRVA